MKKLLLGAILLFSVLGCQTKEDKLVVGCERYLVKSLDDPSSYERIEVVILDTISEIGSNKISYINVGFGYRAKNKMGVLVINAISVKYYPNSKGDVYKLCEDLSDSSFESKKIDETEVVLPRINN